MRSDALSTIVLQLLLLLVASGKEHLMDDMIDGKGGVDRQEQLSLPVMTAVVNVVCSYFRDSKPRCTILKLSTLKQVNIKSSGMSIGRHLTNGRKHIFVCNRSNSGGLEIRILLIGDCQQRL
mmetsp:Transcript_34513/g.39943  ORF Transcript_34513/g.39943 Transcript_34513/m.39943 type:complete len:122 (-) Transcript_34513:1184-1549(-)